MTTLVEARAEALFASWLTRDDVSPARVQAAVRDTVRRLGMLGCACCVAEEFGEHPETAQARMRWALGVVAATWPARGAL